MFWIFFRTHVLPSTYYGRGALASAHSAVSLLQSSQTGSASAFGLGGVVLELAVLAGTHGVVLELAVLVGIIGVVLELAALAFRASRLLFGSKGRATSGTYFGPPFSFLGRPRWSLSVAQSFLLFRSAVERALRIFTTWRS